MSASVIALCAVTLFAAGMLGATSHLLWCAYHERDD